MIIKEKKKKRDSEKGIEIVLAWAKNKIRKTIIFDFQGVFINDVFWLKIEEIWKKTEVQNLICEQSHLVLASIGRLDFFNFSVYFRYLINLECEGEIENFPILAKKTDEFYFSVSEHRPDARSSSNTVMNIAAVPFFSWNGVKQTENEEMKRFENVER